MVTFLQITAFLVLACGLGGCLYISQVMIPLQAVTTCIGALALWGIASIINRQEHVEAQNREMMAYQKSMVSLLQQLVNKMPSAASRPASTDDKPAAAPTVQLPPPSNGAENPIHATGKAKGTAEITAVKYIDGNTSITFRHPNSYSEIVRFEGDERGRMNARDHGTLVYKDGRVVDWIKDK